ncbi:PLC-like phosphodiesterase [Sarocladium strictum]
MTVETKPLLKKMAAAPRAPWADAIPSAQDPKRYLPQAIAHRGYKAKYPENSILAFDAAVDIGAHAIETDVHLTADGVVVMSHDPTGKRCFGVDQKISDCSWESIQWWRTLRKPHQPMARFEDVLAWLNQPKNEKIWIVLDIKVDDPAVVLLSAIARAMEKNPSTSRPWNERIVLGCWNASFTTVARRLLPAFPLVHISISPFYSRHFFRIPGMGMNMNQMSLIGPVGWYFLRKVRKDNRQLFVWTVNSERWMRWCIRKNACLRAQPSSNIGDKNDDPQNLMQGVKVIDGVITDDPELFLQVCKRWEDEQDGKVEKERVGLRSRAKSLLSAAAMSVLVQIAVMLLLARNFYFGRVDFFKRGDGSA